MPRKRRVSKERRSRLWAFFWEWSDEWDADDDLDLSVFGRAWRWTVVRYRQR